MAKGTRICKVCGKEYEYCHTWNNSDKFRWQDVACSPECGSVYFARILASRSTSKQLETADGHEIKTPVNEVKPTSIVDDKFEKTEDTFEEEEVSIDLIENESFSEDEAVG